MAKTHILVTGGAGYIGSHTCKALNAAGFTPLVYDNLSTGHRALARWGDFVHGDILDTPRLAGVIRTHTIGGVIHFAAKAYVGESVIAPDEYYAANIAGTLSLLRAMHATDVRRIVVSSSCAVYGQPSQMPISESCPLMPVNPYGFTKYAMERMVDDFGNAFGLAGVALRYFNAAGCDRQGETGELHEPETHLIPRAIKAALGRIPPLEVFGSDYPTADGTCVRDYVHVEDLADAHVRALSYLFDGGPSAKLNLGTGKGFSVMEIIKSVQAVLQKEAPHVMKPRRAGDPPCLIADAAKARSVLGWIPENSGLETIVQSAVAWEQAVRAKSS
ncbi:MAG: UDP-glucose 4-epimerase GalE [Deltaproteobacteria bacterium]|jgi:UDP-glucose-4-epimerase GalE|nr:UDP-glucose 4-epimerase GalE [Deltaproteobacteria bacterium]